MSRQRKQADEAVTPKHIIDAFEEVMKTTAGQEVLGAVLSFAGLHRQDLVFGNPDQSNFKAGQRSIANWVFRTMMEADPAAAAAYIQSKGNELRDRRRNANTND